MIRKAKKSDVAAIKKILAQMSPYQIDGDFFDTIANSSNYFLWVAEENGVVIGTIMMHIQYKIASAPGAHIEDLVVDQNHRKKGIGEQLLLTAINKAEQLNCYKVMLSCFEKTTTFYERFQFKKHDIGMKLDLRLLRESQ